MDRQKKKSPATGTPAEPPTAANEKPRIQLDDLIPRDEVTGGRKYLFGARRPGKKKPD